MARRKKKTRVPTGFRPTGALAVAAKQATADVKNRNKVKLLNFNKALDRAFERVSTEKAAQLQRVLAFNFVEKVLPMTPVDTGRARGNWQIEIGLLPTGETGVLDKTGQVTLQSAQAKLDRYVQEIQSSAENGSSNNASVQKLQVVWVANNTPYIEVLDSGFKVSRKTGQLVSWSDRGKNFFEKAIAFVRSRLKT